LEAVMELLESFRRLVVEIRNSRDLEDNLNLFFELVRSNQREILATFNIRWLVSICDTYADHGTEIERRNALLISMFVNMLRLAETYKLASGPLEEARLNKTRDQLVPLYEGVSTFAIDRQDVYLNLSKRMARLLPDTPFLDAIWRVILKRLHSGNNVISQLRDLSRVPEPYFPDDPLTLPDNYGVV
jgi:hypothetical protein